MLVQRINIFSLTEKEADAICITTNGYVNTVGCGVMGAGVALQLLRKYPTAAKILGSHLIKNGNVPGILFQGPPAIVSFPTKHAKYWTVNSGSAKCQHPGWKGPSSLSLIQESAKLLVKLSDQNSWKRIYLPAPGIGNGQLDWSSVRKVLLPVLDDRFTLCFWSSKKEEHPFNPIMERP